MTYREPLRAGAFAIVALVVANCGSEHADVADDPGELIADAGTPGPSGEGDRGNSSGRGGGPGAGDAGAPIQSRADASARDAVEPNSAVAPPSKWAPAMGDIAAVSGGANSLWIVTVKPDTGRLIAGISKVGLYASDDNGMTWTKLGKGAGSAVINNIPTSIVLDPKDPNTFWESGMYGDGVFKTTDNGQTFVRLGTLTHLDMVTVDFTDPERKTLLAGAHEQKRKLFLSTDAGRSWKDIGASLPADSHFSSLPLILDSKTFLLGSCGWGSGVCGVYRSADGGATWARAGASNPMERPLMTSNGTIYWSTIYDSGMITAPEGGETWTKAASGPITSYPVELPDGRVVTVGKKNLIITSDGGKSWKPIGDPLPVAGGNCGIRGVTYSAKSKTFFIWQNGCKSGLIPNAMFSAGFDERTE